MRQRGQGYQLSQRNRKKIEELFGEGKDNHGLRRVRRRFLDRVGQEVLLIATVLNYKRLAAVGARAARAVTKAVASRTRVVMDWRMGFSLNIGG